MGYRTFCLYRRSVYRCAGLYEHDYLGNYPRKTIHVISNEEVNIGLQTGPAYCALLDHQTRASNLDQQKQTSANN